MIASFHTASLGRDMIIDGQWLEKMGVASPRHWVSVSRRMLGSGQERGRADAQEGGGAHSIRALQL